MCICTIYDEARYRLLQLNWRNCICSRKCAQVSLESLMYIWLYFLQFLLAGNGFHVQFLQFPSSHYYSTLSGFCRYWVSCNKKLYSTFFSSMRILYFCLICVWFPFYHQKKNSRHTHLICLRKNCRRCN